MERKKILVLGDFMVDIYTFGDVTRISPEAPVPVLRVLNETRKSGGAGNAILNLVSLGMDVVAVGRVGNDLGGSAFLQEMAKEDVDTRGILCDHSFQTPLKNRLIAAGQQLARVDHEHAAPLERTQEKEVLAKLPRLLQGVDLIAISDYAKGFLTQSLLADVMQLGKQLHIPVIVDPKGRDFSRYKGATLIKPNCSEAIVAAGLGMEATLDDVAERILQVTESEFVMITRANEGISVYSGCRRQDFPAQVHEVKDVTGAGDTVLAVVAAALANHMPMQEAAQLANVAAGIAIERIGCARVTYEEIQARLSLIF